MFSGGTVSRIFLSIQAQDFIEERANAYADAAPQIPEHSSSGLH